MRAIVMTRHGGPEVLETRTSRSGARPARSSSGSGPSASTMPIPTCAPGSGRSGSRCSASSAWESSSGTPVALTPGATVVAVVGGLARDRNGSYAELVTVPVTNVVAVDTELTWADLAAIPEVYATAWTALHGNLALEPGQSLLVRGATSAVGQAAVNLAVDGGVTVIATTRAEGHAERLRGMGAAEVLIDDGRLAPQVRATRSRGVDAVLDLVGNAVLRDSLQCVASRGRVCQIGFLAGLDPVADFNPLADLPSGVALSTFASAFVLGGEGFPVSDVPMQAIVDKAERGVFSARPARVFAFDQIVEAHRVMDSGQAGGKLVVTV